MKKIITLIMFLFIGISANAQKDNVVHITENGDTLASISPTFTDTLPLTSKEVYQDFKAALNSMGETLKVGSEHVYEVLIKQQVINSWSYLIVLVIGLILVIIGGLLVGGYDFEILGICMIIVGGFAFLVMLFFIPEIITGFTHPEYGAMKEIMNVIR